MATAIATPSAAPVKVVDLEERDRKLRVLTGQMVKHINNKVSKLQLSELAQHQPSVVLAVYHPPKTAGPNGGLVAPELSYFAGIDADGQLLDASSGAVPTVSLLQGFLVKRGTKMVRDVTTLPDSKTVIDLLNEQELTKGPEDRLTYCLRWVPDARALEIHLVWDMPWWRQTYGTPC